MNRRWNLIATLPAAALLLALSAQAAPVTYKIDPAHSETGFTVRHLFSKVNGRFNTFMGTFVYDAGNPAASSVNVEIEATSIFTGQDRRDAHLRSADFFDVEKFPKLTFVSKSVKAAGKDKLEIAGDLTMHGVTKPVTLVATYLGGGPGMDGANRVGFEATGQLNRKDFGVSWNKALDKGGMLLGDDVDLRIAIEAMELPASSAK
jgi:polyisoprenoid-binding protein YceI